MEKWKSESNKKAVGIIRRSSVGQEGNTSAGSQRKDIELYCKEHGLTIVAIHEITESAWQSGARKKYREIQIDRKRLGAKHEIYPFSHRESRNLTDVERNEDEVKNGTLILHYAVERFVLYKDSPDSDFLMREYQAVQNKHYSRDLSTKVKRATKSKAENGDWPYRHTPLGYSHHKESNKYGGFKKGTARLGRDPNARNVEQINREFFLRSEGRSFDEIAEVMWGEGWVTGISKSGYRATLTKRLKNPLYWGYFYLTGNPKRHQGRHELIIPKDVLDKVKAINEGNPNRPTRPFNEQGVFSGGWLNCGHPECGLQIVYDPKVKTIKETGEQKTYPYYRCTNQRKVHGKKSYVNEEKIMDAFESAIESFEITPEFAEDIKNALNEAHDKQNQAIKIQAEGHRKALKDLEQSEDRAYGLLEDGSIEKSVYRKKIEQVRKQRDYYNHKLEELNIAISDAGHAAVEEVFELAINAKSQWKMMNRQKRVEYLKEVCSNPVLDELSIRYCLQEPFARLASWRGNKEWRRGRITN